jgi:hypothetical protein
VPTGVRELGSEVGGAGLRLLDLISLRKSALCAALYNPLYELRLVAVIGLSVPQPGTAVVAG